MKNLLLISLVCPLSWLLVGLIRQWAERRQVFDIPNHRSSHTRPVSRGGGLAIAVATLSVWLLNGWFSSVDFRGVVLPYACGAALIAAVSWLDDLHTLSTRLRFAVHSLG